MNPRFRRVWIGATISATGDAASWIALVALALGPAKASIAVLAVAYTAPVAVGGLAAGWALDRFDRRRVLALDSAARALVFAAVPVAAFTHTLHAGLLYLAAAAYGLLKMVTLAGFPALIPSLVDPDELNAANALEGASYGLASLVGAGLGGAVIGVAGPSGAAWLIVADVASYLVFAVLVSTVRTTSATGVEAPAGTGSLREVVRRVRTDTALRSTTLMFAAFNVAEGMLLVFLPRRAASLGLGTGGYGYLIAALTAGELVAAATLARREWRRPLLASIIGAQLLCAAITALLVVPSAAVSITVMAALGVASAPMTAWAQTIRMRTVPGHLHGRLFAVLRTAMQATPPLGAALAVATRPYGTAATVATMVACMAVPVAVCAFGLLRYESRVPLVD